MAERWWEGRAEEARAGWGIREGGVPGRGIVVWVLEVGLEGVGVVEEEAGKERGLLVVGWVVVDDDGTLALMCGGTRIQAKVRSWVTQPWRRSQARMSR